MYGVAMANSGTCSATVGSSAIAACRVMAPSRIEPLADRIESSSATRFRSTRCSNRAKRIASMGTRLCPPARSLASLPYAAKSSMTSAVESGAWYVNDAGFRTADLL